MVTVTVVLKSEEPGHLTCDDKGSRNHRALGKTRKGSENFRMGLLLPSWLNCFFRPSKHRPHGHTEIRPSPLGPAVAPPSQSLPSPSQPETTCPMPKSHKPLHTSYESATTFSRYFLCKISLLRTKSIFDWTLVIILSTVSCTWKTRHKEQHSSKDKRTALLTFTGMWDFWKVTKHLWASISWSIKREKQCLIWLLQGLTETIHTKWFTHLANT